MPLFRLVAMAVAKVFSKVFGLATITFFGRAPSRDDHILGFVGLVSITWLVGPVAIVQPDVIELAVPFLGDDESLLRAVAIGVTLGLPLVVGYAVSRIHNQPGTHRSTLLTTLAGYAYAPAIGLLVVGLVLIVPVVKGRELVRRNELAHLSVMVDDDGFEAFADHVHDLLEQVGDDVRDSEHAAPVRWLFAGLAKVEGRIFRRGFSPRMDRVLVEVDGDTVEVTLHSTDISVLGGSVPARRIWAWIAEELDPRRAYATWDDESQAVEDEVRACMDRIDEGDPCTSEELDELAARMRELALSAPEWNAIRRQVYRVALASARMEGTQDAREVS